MDNISGALPITSGKLVTANNSIKREYDGTRESDGAVNDPASMPSFVAKAVYYRVTLAAGASLPSFVSISYRHVDSPRQTGDYASHDSTGREISIKILGSYAVTFWEDHPAREIKITALRSVDRA